MKLLKNVFGKSESDSSKNEESEKSVKYQCPMRCEGKKVYDNPGTCPVCKMKLVPVE